MELLREIVNRVNFAMQMKNVRQNAQNLLPVVDQEMELETQKEIVHPIAYVSAMESAKVYLVFCCHFKVIIIHYI